MGARFNALKSAALKFQMYAAAHREKNTPEGNAKATVNSQLAETMEQALRTQGDFSIGSDVWPGLSKLIEEDGEVLQVAGKLIGTCGEVNHWDGTNLAHRMEEELGDLLAAIDFVVEKNPQHLHAYKIQNRRNEKLKLFRKWHLEVPPLPNAVGDELKPDYYIVDIYRTDTFTATATWSDGYTNSLDLRHYMGEDEAMIRGRLESLRAQGQVST